MQKIVSAEVFKNSRILLGEDCHIRYNPNSPYQVIIGQNGIGKTSFLHNLTSYPSLGGKVFHKDGFSNVIFERDGVRIETRQQHDGKYSFVVDNEEKNVGGTKAVQCDMFTEYLGITPTVQQVLDPTFDFLAMRPNQRQEFLAKLTTGDLSFALQLHKRLEQRARQHDNAVKRMEVNLLELKSKAIAPDEYEGHKASLEKLQQEITELYMEIDNNAQNASGSDIDTLSKRISDLEKSLTTEWVKYYAWGGCDGGSEAGAIDILHSLRNSITAEETKLEGLMQQFQMFSEVKDSLNNGDVGDITNRLASLERELEQLPDPDTLMDIWYDTESDYRSAIRELESSLEQIAPLIAAITGDWTEDLLRSDLEALRKKVSLTQQQIYKLDAEIEAIDKELDHSHSGEVRCPDCGKQFNPKLDERRKETLLKRKDEVTAARQRGQNLLDELVKRGTLVKEMQDQYRNIHSKLSGYALRPVLDCVNSQTSLLEDPQQWFRLLNQSLITLRVRGHQCSVEADIQVIRKQQEMLESQNLGSNQSLTEKMTHLEDQIWHCQRRTEKLRNELREHSERMDKVRRYEAWAERQNALYEQLGDNLLSLAEYELNQMRKDALIVLQSSASNLATLIANYEKDHNQIEYLEGLIESERKEGEAAKLSAEELSPKTGVIAEQLFGFISAFLDDVMEICNNIWTYHVEIYPGKDSASSLTYLFPVEFNYSSTQSEDIAKTSEGQYSLINFAIKVTCLRYLGYSNAPIYLDEPDGDIHPVHKVKMMNFIRALVEEEVFSQVFMISHHESGWGALPYPDLVDFSQEHTLAGTNDVIKFK